MPKAALSTGPEHYKCMQIQPMEFCRANMGLLSFESVMQFNIQKYTWRRKHETKRQDIEKIKHICDIWLERLDENLSEVHDEN